MPPTVLAGQNFDLQDSPENIVKNMIKYRWKNEREGLIPASDEIAFSSLFGWTGRKSYQITVEPSTAPFIESLAIGPDTWLKYNDPLIIHVWIRKLKDEPPPQMHHITQKIEQIVLENKVNVGYGITGIQLAAPFSAIESREHFNQSTGSIDTSLQNPTEVSLWHTSAVVELIYFRVTTGVLDTVRAFKTHKYNIEA